MSRYFDKAKAEIRIDFNNIIEVEKKVVHDVRLVFGDIECPEYFRQQGNFIIANYAYYLNFEEPYISIPHYNSGMASECSRSSVLIDMLHALFHKLAEYECETRWGQWSDNPEFDLRKRGDWINKNIY